MDQKYWLKGGIIGVLSVIIILIINHMLGTYNLFMFLWFPQVAIILFFGSFIVGVLVGLVYGRIKKVN